MKKSTKLKARFARLIRDRKWAFSSTLGVIAIFALYQNCGALTSPMSTTTNGARTTTTTTTTTTGSYLMISPSSTSVAVNGTVTFSASGGSGSGYTFTKVSGNGTISSSGVFAAPSYAETDQIKVTDSSGNTANAWINVTTSSTGNQYGTGTVVFMGKDGTGTQVSKSFYAGTYNCSVASFGSDPDEGHAKGCYVNSVLIASEGGSFTVDYYGNVTGSGGNTTNGTVNFQAQDGTGSTITRTFTAGIYSCSNSTFGYDPDSGHLKACYVNGYLVVSENVNFVVSSTGVVTSGATATNSCSYTGQSGAVLTLVSHGSDMTSFKNHTTIGWDSPSMDYPIGRLASETTPGAICMEPMGSRFPTVAEFQEQEA